MSSKMNDEIIIKLHVPKEYFQEMKYWTKKTNMELGEMLADAFEQWKVFQSTIATGKAKKEKD